MSVHQLKRVGPLVPIVPVVGSGPSGLILVPAAKARVDGGATVPARTAPCEIGQADSLSPTATIGCARLGGCAIQGVLFGLRGHPHLGETHLLGSPLLLDRHLLGETSAFEFGLEFPGP